MQEVDRVSRSSVGRSGFTAGRFARNARRLFDGSAGNDFDREGRRGGVSRGKFGRTRGLQEDRRQQSGRGYGGDAEELVDVRHGISPVVDVGYTSDPAPRQESICSDRAGQPTYPQNRPCPACPDSLSTP